MFRTEDGRKVFVKQVVVPAQPNRNTPYSRTHPHLFCQVGNQMITSDSIPDLKRKVGAVVAETVLQSLGSSGRKVSL